MPCSENKRPWVALKGCSQRISKQFDDRSAITAMRTAISAPRRVTAMGRGLLQQGQVRRYQRRFSPSFPSSSTSGKSRKLTRKSLPSCRAAPWPSGQSSPKRSRILKRDPTSSSLTFCAMIALSSSNTVSCSSPKILSVYQMICA